MLPSRTRGRQYRGISEQERQRERRERLIEAGVRVFGEHGYQAATVKSICQAAGLTERYFYESFANREKLFRVVYDTLIARVRTAIVDVLSAEDKPENMARAGLNAYFSLLRNEPFLARIILIEATRVGGDMQEVWRETTDQFTALLRSFAPLFLKGSKASGIDLDVLAAGLVGGTINISMVWYLSGYRKPLDVIVEGCYLQFVAIRTFLTQTAKRPPSKRSPKTAAKR